MASSSWSCWSWLLLVVAALLVRILVGVHGHSGYGCPPMFGDFEAQRHWMEVTLHLPVSDWYRQTPRNDLLYWGLDYPPLTAYVSLFFAWVATATGCGEVVAWVASRGVEDEKARFFMRATVLLCDVLVFIPVTILSTQQVLRWWRQSTEHSAEQGSRAQDTLRLVHRFFVILAALLCPGLLIIDHGHFQYNGVCIGLALLGVYFISLKEEDKSPSSFWKSHVWEILGSASFCLSLNFKQMSLYYAPVFFFALLRRCAVEPTVWRKVIKLAIIGTTVIVVFAGLWVPFCLFPATEDGETCVSSLLHVLQRQFPFNRGIFEDKVSNLWYVLSVVVDVREILSTDQLVRCSLFATLAFLAPVAVFLLTRRLTVLRAQLSLIVSALAFFLLSFQVHEKSILLAAVPSVLLLAFDAELVHWFQMLAMFSMYPLLKRDKLCVAYVACVLLYSSLVEFSKLALKYGNSSNIDLDAKQQPGSISSEALVRSTASEDSSIDPQFLDVFKKIRFLMSLFIKLSFLGMIALHVMELTYTPPPRYPDLFPALFSIFGALNFLVAYIYHVFWLWASRDEPTLSQNEKIKDI